MVTSAQSSMIRSAMAPGQLVEAISTAVTAKTLDAARQQGANVIKLLEGADISRQQSPGAGDPLVAKATGLGGNLDVLA